VKIATAHASREMVQQFTKLVQNSEIAEQGYNLF
jgi:hypothetical protein